MSTLFLANSSSPPSPKSLVGRERRKLPANRSRRFSPQGLQPKPKLETQRCAVELSALFDNSLSELHTGVLEEMPPQEVMLVLVSHTARLLGINVC